MAESISVKNSEGQLTCSVCQSRFNEMVLSSCFHSFCSDCLRIQVNKSRNAKTYACPLCNAVVTLPDSFHGNDNHQYDNWSSFSESNDAGGFCDICVDRKIAVNRCLQCEESFCEDCTNAHLRMKSSRYHGQRVVPIRDQGQQEKYTDTKEETRFCPRHRNEEIIVVCKQCGVLLCIVCKLLEHENHVTKHITEDAGNIRQKLSDLLQNQIGYSENLQMQIRLLENKKTLYPRELDQELSKVRMQATKLHNAIEKETSDTERELVSHYGEYTLKSSRMGEFVKQDYEEYVNLAREAQRLLDCENDAYVSKNGELVYERLKRMERENSTMSNMDQGKPDKKFLAGDINERQMSDLIGKISLDNKGKVERIWSSNSSVSDHQRHPRRVPAADSRGVSASTVSSTRDRDNAGPQLLNQIWLPFSDSLGYVCGISPAGNQQVWVTMLDHKYILLVDQHGIVKMRVEIGEACEGVASDGEGGCFVTCPQNKSIKRVRRSGEVTTVVDDFLQDPHGVASLIHYDKRQFTMQQELYVCLTEPKGLGVMNFETNSQSNHGCVGALSFSGSDLGISIPVRSPVRVAVSSDTMMLGIVDHSNGCVMVTDKTGQFVQALYSGPENGRDDFKPLGVCFDGSGCAIFADWEAGKICRMTPDGSHVNDLIVNLDGPQSVAVSDGNVLWVGTKLGKIHVYKLS